jgi:hypothetical protein
VTEPELSSKEMTRHVADRRDNVIVLPNHGAGSNERPPSTDALRAAAGQLEELGRCLQEISPHANWSAQRWMIASTPFRMRLIGARRKLSDLAKLGSADEQSDIRWMFEVNDARLGAERRLHDIDACLQTLQDVNASITDRIRETETFAASRFELLKVLDKIRHLLVQRCLTVRHGS